MFNFVENITKIHAAMRRDYSFAEKIYDAMDLHFDEGDSVPVELKEVGRDIVKIVGETSIILNGGMNQNMEYLIGRHFWHGGKFDRIS